MFQFKAYHVEPRKSNFWDIAYPYKLFIFQYCTFLILKISIIWRNYYVSNNTDINNILISINRFILLWPFWRLLAMLILMQKKIVGSSLYISRQIFPKLLNTSASNNIWPSTWKSWYSSKFCFWKSLQTLFVCT